MKKIISLLTCIAIIFGTFSICASAATPNELLSGEPSFIITLFRNILNIFGLQKATDITISGSDEFKRGDEGNFVITVTAGGKEISSAGFAYYIYTYKTDGDLKDSPVISDENNNTKNYEIQMPENPGKYFILVVSNDGGYKAGLTFRLLNENGTTEDIPTSLHIVGTFTYNGQTYQYTDKPSDMTTYLNALDEDICYVSPVYLTPIYEHPDLSKALPPEEKREEKHSVFFYPLTADGQLDSANKKRVWTVPSNTPGMIMSAPLNLPGYTFIGWQHELYADDPVLYRPGEYFDPACVWNSFFAVYINNKTNQIYSPCNIETHMPTQVFDNEGHPRYEPYTVSQETLHMLAPYLQ